MTSSDSGLAPVPRGSDALDRARHRWAFLSNHFLVLLAIAEEPGRRVRDISLLVGITERATQAILKDLVDERYLERTRVGRRNHYRVWRTGGLRHAMLDTRTVGALLDVLDLRGSHEPT